MTTYLQIGTNVAYDWFFELVKKNKPDRIILVEPFEANFESIHNCYKEYNYELIEGLIHGEKDEENVSIFLPDNNINRTQHATLEPMKDWGIENLEPITVKAYNFNTICEKLNIDEIEILCIDTEGYDNIIINSIDFAKIQINNIITEKWGFSADTYDKDNPLLGLPGEEIIKEKLLKYNYIREDFFSGEFEDMSYDFIFKLKL